MTRFRRITGWIHLYVGLAVAPPLLMLGITGSILSFEYPLDHLLNPKLNYVQPLSSRVPLDDLVRLAAAASPGGRVTKLTLSPYSAAPDLAYTALVAADHGQIATVYLDQYTDRILGQRTRPTFIQQVHNLHTNLLTGEDRWGSFVLGGVAALLMILSLTGVILWWPRKIFEVRWQASARRINFDLHNALGFYSFLFMLLFGMTGAVIRLEPALLPATNRALHINDQEPRFQSSPVRSDMPKRTVEAVFRSAVEAVPGARVTQMAFPLAGGVYRIWMKYPEDRTPLGRTIVLVDPYSSAVLWKQTSRSAPVTTRYFRQWNHELHTGDFFGLTGKILLCLMSLVLPVLTVTGPLFWFQKQRHLRRASQPLRAKPNGVAR